MGELRGITLTSELHVILVAVLALPQRRQPQTTGNDSEDDDDVDDATPKTHRNDYVQYKDDNPRSSRLISTSHQMTVDSATSILNEAFAIAHTTSTASKSTNLNATDNNSTNHSSRTIPALSLEGVIAAKFLIDHTGNDDNHNNENKAHSDLLLNQLETALRSSTLIFESSSNSNSNTNATPSSYNNNAAFAKRLERLRLHSEERSYSRLTTNIQHPASHKAADDITVKSMTYAASVGLNMIVGPLAFGTFMYFFAGGVLNRFFDSNEDDNGRGRNGVDVRRVIAGVVSGVFMLFVEMILFVIRSHELDASVRKKGRKAEYRANPFGYTQKSMARTYVGD